MYKANGLVAFSVGHRPTGRGKNQSASICVICGKQSEIWNLKSEIL